MPIADRRGLVACASTAQKKEKPKMKGLMGSALICCLGISCMETDRSRPMLEAEIMRTDAEMSRMAEGEGFNKALLFYADDGFVKFTEGQHPAIGKAMFEKNKEGKAGTKFLTWAPVGAEVSGSGDLGYTWGNWKLTLADTVIHGNYFSGWKRHADGSWKLALDGGKYNTATKIV